MKCKKCNYELEREWKFCPICSTKIKKKNYLPILIGGISLVLLVILYLKIGANNMSEEERAKRYLEKTYNKKIDTVTFIDSTKNPDTSLSCDGANLTIKKGKGYKKSYLAHSNKENLDFIICYDTNTEKYNDNYKYSLKLRKCAVKLYKEIESIFYEYNEKITFSNDINKKSISPKIITSEQDLYDLLSESHDGTPNTSLDMYVNMNSLEFCKKEYNNIKAINQFLSKLDRNNALYGHMGLSIYTLDNARLKFSESGDVHVYHSKTGEETIEKFIQRDDY